MESGKDYSDIYIPSLSPLVLDSFSSPPCQAYTITKATRRYWLRFSLDSVDALQLVCLLILYLVLFASRQQSVTLSQSFVSQRKEQERQRFLP